MEKMIKKEKGTPGRVDGLNAYYSQIVANNIKIYCQSLHLTVAQLAEKIGTPRMTVYLWINEKTTPGLAYLVRMSETFGCTIDELTKVDQSDEESKKEFIELLRKRVKLADKRKKETNHA